MGSNAIAVLYGRPRGVRDVSLVLHDGTLARVRLPDGPDEVVARTLAVQLGDALDAHPDPRGVFVFSASTRPKARTYDEVVEEVEGRWIALPSLLDRLLTVAMGRAEHAASAERHALDAAEELLHESDHSDETRARAAEEAARILAGDEPREAAAHS